MPHPVQYPQRPEFRSFKVLVPCIIYAILNALAIVSIFTTGLFGILVWLYTWVFCFVGFGNFNKPQQHDLLRKFAITSVILIVTTNVLLLSLTGHGVFVANLILGLVLPMFVYAGSEDLKRVQEHYEYQYLAATRASAQPNLVRAKVRPWE